MKKKAFSPARVLIKILTLTIILVLLLFAALVLRSLSHDINYQAMNDADLLNIYKDGDLIASLDSPSKTLGVVDAVYITNQKQLGLSMFSMKELYVLEYVSDDKVISRIKILTPLNSKAIVKLDNKGKLNEWNRLNGEYVVMRDKLCYFSLGNHYYVKLSEIIGLAEMAGVPG